MARSAFGSFTSTGLGDQYRLGSPRGGRLSTSGDAGLKIEVEGDTGSDFALAIQGRLQSKIDGDLRALELAYYNAMDTVVVAGKGRLRSDVAAGGFHQANALSKTWRGNTYPKGKNSLEVAGWLYTKMGVIIDAFSMGVTIRVSGGRKFLAIPLAPAKAIIRKLRRAKMTGSRSGASGRDAFGRYTKDDSYVEQVASALNTDLVPVISRDGQRGVLVPASRVTLTATGREARDQKKAATPVFALVKSATLRRRIKGRQILEDIERNFGSDFAHALSGFLLPENRSA